MNTEVTAFRMNQARSTAGLVTNYISTQLDEFSKTEDNTLFFYNI